MGLRWVAARTARLAAQGAHRDRISKQRRHPSPALKTRPQHPVLSAVRLSQDGEGGFQQVDDGPAGPGAHCGASGLRSCLQYRAQHPGTGLILTGH